eukprot:40846-Pyramimonas_sp.AAC.2
MLSNISAAGWVTFSSLRDKSSPVSPTQRSSLAPLSAWVSERGRQKEQPARSRKGPHQPVTNRTDYE